MRLEMVENKEKAFNMCKHKNINRENCDLISGNDIRVTGRLSVLMKKNYFSQLLKILFKIRTKRKKDIMIGRKTEGEAVCLYYHLL